MTEVIKGEDSGSLGVLFSTSLIMHPFLGENGNDDVLASSLLSDSTWATGQLWARRLPSPRGHLAILWPDRPNAMTLTIHTIHNSTYLYVSTLFLCMQTLLKYPNYAVNVRCLGCFVVTCTDKTMVSSHFA